MAEGGIQQQRDSGGRRRAPLIPKKDKETLLFGKYEVGRLLGCGAFAKVYHGRNLEEGGQSVAMKVINKKKIASSSVMMSNVKREVSIMRRLSHPNVVKLFEVLATKTKIYFVLELVKGGELFTKVAKGRFSESLSRRFFQQLISAVAHCHSRGVLHRDLKPENLLVDENGDLKVSDFGLSAAVDQKEEEEDGMLPSQLHTLCGTPAYVAPEILAKKGYDGAKVDVWSCGVILFVLNAGFLPFNNPNLMAMYKKICKGDFKCPKWMSPDLKRFLSRLLDTNPNTRITVHEILQDPWFNKGGLDPTTYAYACSSSEKEEEHHKMMMKKTSPLNAFDIISFSSGLDLSGLFDQSRNSIEEEEDGERFVLDVSPDKLMERIQELAKEEGLRAVKNGELGFRLEGSKQLLIGIEVYRLTHHLVVLEAKRGSGDMRSYNQTWKNKLRPQLTPLPPLT